MRLVRVTITILTLLVLGAGGYYGHLVHSGNFHTVVPGELYRSAQPTPERLRAYVEDLGIRTIINLRGKHAGESWYGSEAEVARELGVTLVDFRMSARKMVSQRQADRLMEILKTAMPPILVHCRAGADRSGLATALYLAAVKRSDERTAEAMLSIRFGHVGIPYLSATYAIDRSWEQLEPQLGFVDS